MRLHPGFAMPDVMRSFARALYRNRNYRFWAYQCGGWVGYSLATFFSITVMDDNVSAVHLAHIALQALLGILFSWPLRPIYRATFDAPLLTRTVVSVVSILLFSALWTASRIYTFILMSGEAGLWAEFNYWLFGSLFVFLSWSVLYYGVHYYELLALEHQKLLEEVAAREKEKLQRLQAESAAREAQLRMLRYQLNPHFLFNTLNAISAHVRMGETSQAGEMIQFLSRFLRHTLEHDSIDDIPLSQELDTLQLYLNIEQARFGERLQLDFSIEPVAMDALVPSLLLQPIVENAMKYAIEPSEQGGTVQLRARIRGPMLELQVIDSGPGLSDGELAERGIGLSNTLERLRTLYGNDYEFLTESQASGGLVVTIRLPYHIAWPMQKAGGEQ